MKKIILFLILLIVIIEVLFTVHMIELKSISGHPILDFTINNHEEVYQIISDYGLEGIKIYNKIQVLDLVFPFAYGMLLTLVLKTNQFKYYGLPLFATAMDLSENLCINRMLSAFPEELNLVGLLNVFIILKFTILLSSVLIYIIIKLRRRTV